VVSGTQVGAYRLLEQIGEGGMGAVWLAEHTMLGRRAAIKVLHPSFTSRPEIVTRFFNEARAATAIADPGIVQIFDFGHHTDGSAYIVMELLVGETLHARMTRVRRFAVADALRIVRQITGSLGAAHARGIIHRDLKPENIFLVRDPEVAGGERAKILDFGIAKLVGDPSLQTNASLVIGTPAFMSPEQCRGAGQVDQRSDIYALGCILFALLAGRPPFVAAGAGELIAMHLVNDPPRLSELVPGLPPNVEAVIMACLAKQPERRYASGQDLAAALGNLLDTLPPTTPVRVTPAAGMPQYAPQPTPTPIGVGAATAATGIASYAASPTTLSAAAGVSVAPSGPRSRRRWFGLGAAAVVIGAATAVIVATHDPASTTAPVVPAHVAAPVPAAQPARPAPPTPAPVPAPVPAAVDPAALLAPRIKDVFARFASWASTHAGAPCPDVAALGGNGNDPWNHPLQLTCDDQPATQIIGAVSAGPDGISGTDDDLASWQLGRDVTDAVRGKRWVTKRAHSQPPIHTTRPPPAQLKPMFDENGIPINRR
jgi:serine/threonine-protein kinase